MVEKRWNDVVVAAEKTDVWKKKGWLGGLLNDGVEGGWKDENENGGKDEKEVDGLNEVVELGYGLVGGEERGETPVDDDAGGRDQRHITPNYTCHTPRFQAATALEPLVEQESGGAEGTNRHQQPTPHTYCRRDGRVCNHAAIHTFHLFLPT